MKKLLLILSLLCCCSSLMSTGSSLPNNAKSLALSDGLVAYYPFNGNANDESGNGNHGTIIGNVELVADKDGNPNSAYRFPGQPLNYISVPDNEVLHCSTFTLSAWVFTDAEDYSYGYLINKGRDITNGSYRLRVNDVGATVKYGGSNDAYIDDIPETKVWHFIAGTVEGDVVKFYLDGVLKDQRTLSYPFEYNNSEPLTLGMHYYSGVPSYWAYPLNGVLDEVRIYNRALSDDEVKLLAEDANDVSNSLFGCPDNHHPHMIDLGLPSGTLWACCNVDASTPDEYGGYYAWGETQENRYYDLDEYDYYDKNNGYTFIGDDISGTEYDVAYVKWGDSWCMPSCEQIEELCKNCSYTWTTLNDVTGAIVTGPNGSTIFLPASGLRWLEGREVAGELAAVWTSSFHPNKEKYAYGFGIISNKWGIDYSDKEIGYPIRPISRNSSTLLSLAISAPKNTINIGESITLTPTMVATNGGRNAKSASHAPFLTSADSYGQNLTWRSSNESFATVTDGVVTGKGVGLVNIFAETTDGSGQNASCVLTVKEPDDTSSEVPFYACRGFLNYVGKDIVKGLTADGRSQVYIPWTSDKQPKGTPKITITDSKGNELNAEFSETGYITNLLTSLRNKYGADGFIYEAPMDFKKDCSDNYYLAKISVPVENESNEIYFKYLASVRIYRPGLILVHGLWGNATSFEKFGNYLDNESEYKTFYQLVDYKESNGDTFYSNTHEDDVLNKACTILYNRLMLYGIVSGRYDFVGHSMGGILSRLYIQEVNHDAAHKIITVNTPHIGSGVADRGDELRVTIQQTSVLKSISNKIENFYSENPAIYDLKSTSPAIKSMSESAHVIGDYSIPVHAVCSFLKTPTELDVYDTFEKKFDDGDFTSTISAFYYLFTEEVDDGRGVLRFIFNGDDHDGIVELTSQKGGLSDEYCTIEEDDYKGLFGNSSDAHHMNTTKWAKTHENLESLLKAKTTDPLFDRNGFKDINASQGSGSWTKKKNYELPVLKAPASENTYISIASTLKVENDSVKVDVTLTHSDDIVKNMVFGFLNEDKVITGFGRDDYTLQFPNTYSGSFMLYALGRSANDEIVSDSVLLEIPAMAKVKYITFIGEPSNMSVGQLSKFSVKAIWSNGEETYIEPEFTTSDNSVLRVNGNYIEAVAEGSSMLTAIYEDHTTSVMLEVTDYGEIDGLAEIRSEGEYKIYNDGETLYVEAPDARIRNIELRLFDASGTLIQNLHATTNGNKKAFSLDLGNRKGLFVVQCISDDFKGSYRFVY